MNTSSDKQKVRSASVKAGELRGAGGAAFGEIPLRSRLQPGQQVELLARLPVDPTTPPGSYNFEITVGERTLPALAHVPEVVDLRLEPEEITILASATTSSCTRTVLCENLGNVILLGGSRCEAPVFEPESLLSTALIGLSKGDCTSAASMVTSALAELAGLAVGTLVITRKPMALSPGQKVAVDLQFELPRGLKPQRHYTASLQLYNSTLSVEIYTTTKEEPTSQAG